MIKRNLVRMKSEGFILYFKSKSRQKQIQRPWKNIADCQVTIFSLLGRTMCSGKALSTAGNELATSTSTTNQENAISLCGPSIKSDIGWLCLQISCHNGTCISCWQNITIDKRVYGWFVVYTSFLTVDLIRLWGILL